MERFRLGFNFTRLIGSLLVLVLVLSCGTAAPPPEAAGKPLPAPTELSQPASTDQPAMTATTVPPATSSLLPPSKLNQPETM